MIQGIQAPNVTVDPQSFYAGTRRMRFQAKGLTAIQGLGSTESVQLNQTGILSAIEVRVAGTLTFGGTIGVTTMSYEWPFNLIQAMKLSANGQSNLINCKGLTLRAFEFIANPKLDDTGVGKQFGGAAVTTGTLALPCDDWGTSAGNVAAPGTNIAAVGTYTVDLTFVIPVAADPTYLIGSVYAQSTATNLSLDITWATQAQLVAVLGGAATFASSLSWQATQVAYSIPNVGGRYVVPDLSTFHQLTDFRQSGLGQGTNMVALPGVGTGRQLLRMFWNVYSGAAPQPIPVPMNAAQYAQIDWAFGGSDTPEVYPNGQMLRAENIRVAGVDLGGNWGIGLHDFASQFAARDAVDEGATSNLRNEFNLVNAPTAGYAITAQETLFAAPVGA
jgi:hypothetical protein